MLKKIALITGANKGIGFETAKQLGEKGITVLIGARNKENGEKAAKKLQDLGIDAAFVEVDIANSSKFTSVYNFIESKYGKLDILINNAGISADGGGWGANTTTTISEENLKKTFDTNFFGVVLLTNTLLPLIKKSEAGRIVNLSSILGSLSLHLDKNSGIYESNLFAYNASKTALNAYTVHLAVALEGTKIKVNSAHPGWVKTDMGTDAAPMQIEDGAKTSVALALLDEDGPTGKYIHLGNEIPW